MLSLTVIYKIKMFMNVHAHRNATFFSQMHLLTYTYNQNSLICQLKSTLVKFSFFGIMKTENNREETL